MLLFRDHGLSGGLGLFRAHCFQINLCVFHPELSQKLFSFFGCFASEFSNFIDLASNSRAEAAGLADVLGLILKGGAFVPRTG